MDTALQNGDFAPAANGRPYGIGGTDEMFQRAVIRLTVPAGRFCYDASFGSKLNTLTGKETNPDEKALSLAQEALRAMPNISVLDAKCEKTTPPAVKLTLSCGDAKKEIEIKLD